MKGYTLLALFLILLMGNCARGIIRNPKRMDLMASGSIPYNEPFMDTPIGGISGIFRDTEKESYFLISDDRSQFAPARFYTGEIHVNWRNQELRFVPKAMHFLKTDKGNPYPSFQQDPENSIDPEDIQWSQKRKLLYVSSEGERTAGTAFVGQNPSIIAFDSVGNHQANLSILNHFGSFNKEYGIRRNGAIEALAITPEEDKLLFSTEVPLFHDGREPSIDNGGLLRLIRHDLNQENRFDVFAYATEPLSFEPQPKGAFGVNGLVALLALGNTEFLSVERSYSTGRAACTIRVFACSIKNATELGDIESLENLPTQAKLVDKKLLLNLDDLGVHVDNIEGLTWGPTSPNGKRTILLVADNNFSERQVSQLFLFELD